MNSCPTQQKKKKKKPEKMHTPRASSLEEKCVPTTSHKVCSSDMVQASKRRSARKDASAACIKPRGEACAYHQSQSLLKSHGTSKQKVSSHKRCICYMHHTQRKSVCLPPVTKSVQVTWYKQAKGVQLEKMHRASTKRKSVSASKIVKGRAPVKTRAKRPPTGCQLESTQLAIQ